MVDDKFKKGGGHRKKKTRVRTAKKRSPSSTRWLERQLNDPYVEMAKEEGYRSRAAFKIIEINSKYKIFHKNAVIVDLGAAPGSWSQIVADIIGEGGTLVGIDLLDIEPMPGATFIKGDFTDNDAEKQLLELLPGKADVVLSDMAANTTGHAQTDHIRTMALCEIAFDFAKKVLKNNGAFVAKTFVGGTEKNLLDQIKRSFREVKHFKPKSSRKESPEMYIVALGFNKSV